MYSLSPSDEAMARALDALCQGHLDEETLAELPPAARIALGVFASKAIQKTIFADLEEEYKPLAIPLFHHLEEEDIVSWIDNVQDDLRLVQVLSLASDTIDVGKYLNRLNSETAILLAGESLSLRENEYRRLLDRLSDESVAIAARSWDACPISAIVDRIVVMPSHRRREVIAGMPDDRIRKIERHASDRISVRWFLQEEKTREKDLGQGQLL